MAIAIFGKKTFQVNSKIYTFDGFTLGSSLETESQDVANKKPSTYIKGPGLDTMNFNIPLSMSAGVNVRSEYESWVSIKNVGIAYPFILGKKPIGSKWLLKSVSLNDTKIDNKGNILTGTIELQFEEYVRSGNTKSTNGTSASSKKKNAPGIKTSTVDSKTASQLLSVNKASSKRSNINATAAVAKGSK